MLRLTACLLAFAACGPPSDPPDPAPISPVAVADVATAVGPAADQADAEPGDARAPDPTPAPLAAATDDADVRTNEECRDLAAEVASRGNGRAVDQHTFAFESPRDPGACFMVARYTYTAPQLRPGEPWPYTYGLLVDERGNLDGLEIDPFPRHEAHVAAVGFADINGDGVTDLFVVHEDAADPGLAFLSDGSGWRHALIDNGEPGVFASTVAELKAFWRNPSFPP